jgi:hypothetical protein
MFLSNNHRPIILSALFLAIALSSVAQNMGAIDSMRNVLTTSSRIETRVDALTALGREYRPSYPDSAIFYCNKAIAEGKANGLVHQLALPTNIVGVIYRSNAEYVA